LDAANQPSTAAELSNEITPAAHASGVPRIEVVPAIEPARHRAATWPRSLATTLVILATSLYLLEQLQLVLRPLLIAILLCYLIVPTYLRLRKRMRPVFSFLLIILVLVVGFQALSQMIFSDMTRINHNLPRYQHRAEELSGQARNMFEPFLPPSLLPEQSRTTEPADAPKSEPKVVEELPEETAADPVAKPEAGAEFVGPIRPPTVPTPTEPTEVEPLPVRDVLAESDSNSTAERKQEPATTMVPPPKPMPTESPAWELARRIISQVAGVLASFLLESLVVAFYMIFLLQEAGRFGDRIRSSFSREHATQIEMVTASINRAITDYLSVKVKSSLIVAVPTALTVYAFGITGAATWGVLAFFGNFLPYIGGLVATLLPITLAFLEFESVLYPTLFAVVLLGISGATSNLIEPAMTGKALDLSPLVVMIGLAFWSLLWGLVGMCLAIPLTVVLKIILEHTPATRPIARLLGESQRPG
jgi:predicted PurR-regulated permease PerM